MDDVLCVPKWWVQKKVGVNIAQKYFINLHNFYIAKKNISLRFFG